MCNESNGIYSWHNNYLDTVNFNTYIIRSINTSFIEGIKNAKRTRS